MIAWAVGAQAFAWLSEASSARVLGVSSRGGYLRLAPQGVVFLSREGWRGPLTVNVQAEQAEWAPLGQVGGVVGVGLAGLVLPGTGGWLNWRQAQAWSAPRRPAAPSVLALRQNLDELLKGFPSRASWRDGGAPLTPPSSQRGEGEAAPSPFQGEGAGGIRAALRSADMPRLLAVLLPYLGKGPGLTPSGDDLIGGLLLALARWGEVLAPGIDIHELRIGITGAADNRTTQLSASLLACAALGEADERLLTALDGLVCGGEDLAWRGQALASWGHSSGADALAGMALLV